MAQTFLNNFIFYLDDDLTPGVMSVAITVDVETGSAVSITDPADLTLISDDGKSVERMIVTATGGVMTILQRGIKNDASGTSDSSLEKKWYAGQRCFVTIFASHLITSSIFSSNNTWTGTNTFGTINATTLSVTGTSTPWPIFADATARDTAIPTPIDGQHCRILLPAPVDQVYNGTTAQREDYGIGTPPPMASTTAAGLVKIATAITDPDSVAGVYNVPTPSMVSGAITTQINNYSVNGGGAILDNYFMLGETVLAGEALFPETGPTFAAASTAQNIGDAIGNTKVSFPVFSTGISSSSFKLALAKVDNLGDDLGIRLETDNAGSSSGTLVNPNAYATIARSSLTTLLADTTCTRAGGTGTDAHGVTLNVTEASQTVYKGVKFTLTSQTAMISVDKDSDCTATTAYLYSTAGVLLASALFSTNTATFNYDQLLVGSSYYILCGSDGSAYTSVKQTGSASYPYTGTKLNYVGGGITQNNIISDSLNIGTSSFLVATTTHEAYFTVNTLSTLASVSLPDGVAGYAYLYEGTTLLDTATDGINFTGNVPLSVGTTYTLRWINSVERNYTTATFPTVGTVVTITGTNRNTIGTFGIVTNNVSVVANADINNIVDINYGGTFTPPALGTKCHIVAYQGTYGSETIDPARYFKIGYNTNNTTTRGLKVFNGTNRSGATFVNNGFLSSYYTILEDYSGTFGFVTTDSDLCFHYTPVTRETTGVITTNTLTSSDIAVAATINLYTSNGYSASGGIELVWDANNYVRATCSGESYHGTSAISIEIKVAGVTTYSYSEATSYNYNDSKRLKILKNNTNDYSVYYRSGTAWVQYGVTQTQAFTGDPKFHIAGGWVYQNTRRSSCSSPSVSDTDFAGITPVSSLALFPYVSSTLFNNILLSKTDADYAYKIDLRGLSTENKTAGGFPLLTLQGVNANQSGLVDSTDYFLSQTPGALTATTPPTVNICKVGTALGSTRINMTKQISSAISMTNTTVYRAGCNGIVTARGNADGTGTCTLTGYADTTNGTTTVATKNYATTTTGCGISFQVLKGQYFSVALTSGNTPTLQYCNFFPM